MSASPETRRDFLAVVGDLGVLSADAARELVNEAKTRGVSPTQLALQRGLLDAIQVDIIETLLHPDEVVPGYEILSVIGRGGMGVVYRARQKALDRVVALKTVLVSQMGDSTSVSRFEQEARSVARLRHPNVVTAYDFGRQGGRLYFAMELVEGDDLEEYIRQRGRVDEPTAWGLARQTAAGLAHAHQQGIVHRDIKPANLLLITPPEGFPLPPGLRMVKIADFGLAFLTTEAESRTRLTQANSTVGSPHYMAPEQLTGGPVDQRGDIYSLGATVYHMLTGRPPFSGKTLPQIVAEKVNQESPRVTEHAPDVSQPSATLVAEMMARRPEQRIGSYAELLRRIDALPLSGLGVSRPYAGPALAVSETLRLQHSATLPESADTRSLIAGSGAASRRRRWPWLMAGLLVAGLAAAAAWALLNRGETPPPPRDMVVSEYGDWLYNGRSLNGWNTLSGSWTPHEDEEGMVISGTDGVFRRRFPLDAPRPLEDYRITASFRLHKATSIGFHFGMLASDEDGPRYVLRVSAEGAVLGEQSGDAGKFKPLSALVPLPGNAQRVYAAVQIERQYDHWFAFLGIKQPLLIATAPARNGPHAAEFRLSAEGAGEAYFSDIRLEELVPPKQ